MCASGASVATTFRRLSLRFRASLFLAVRRRRFGAGRADEDFLVEQKPRAGFSFAASASSAFAAGDDGPVPADTMRAAEDVENTGETTTVTGNMSFRDGSQR